MTCQTRPWDSMESEREAFLAGNRPQDVHIYLHEDTIENATPLEPYAEQVSDGLVLVLDGTDARGLFSRVTGIDIMEFARDAMNTDGEIDGDCTGGTCPSCGESPRFVFAFAEEQNEEVGGIYAEGSVIHAYASCPCGERYSSKWVAD